MFNIFKKISGYQRPTNLASDISITQVLVKKALNSQTRKVIFELTIARQEEQVKKDVTVTFKALKVIARSAKKIQADCQPGQLLGLPLVLFWELESLAF